MSKLQKISIVFIPLIIIILEILPTGVVMIFATETDRIRQTYSYFSITPLGYANIGPFISAILSCVIIILNCLYLSKPNITKAKTILIISIIMFFCSLSPLIISLDRFSIIGMLISLGIAFQVLLFFKIINSQKN